MAIDAKDNIYVADVSNNMIRITPDAVVTTFAGQLTAGAADGNGTTASFNKPTCIAVDTTGNVYVTDDGNNLIRKISTAGDVSLIAGTGVTGGNNGGNLQASFTALRGIAVDASGNIYVSDGYIKIRKIIQSK